jgi:hypothetical protein
LEKGMTTIASGAADVETAADGVVAWRTVE